MQSAAFSLWSAVLSDWGFGETREGRKSVLLFLLLVLQPSLRVGAAFAVVWSRTRCSGASYVSSVRRCWSSSVSPCASRCLCSWQRVLELQRLVPRSLRSSLFSRLHVSRYSRFPQGWATHAQSQGHVHADAPVHCPLSHALYHRLCSASRRFCFCGQQMGWHRLSLL